MRPDTSLMPQIITSHDDVTDNGLTEESSKIKTIVGIGEKGRDIA